MAKSKKNNKNSTPSVKVQDLAPEKNPKGGAYDAFIKQGVSPALQKAAGELGPAVPGSLNFNK
jgi:hypothetical protein